jgi:hypothetical protein
MSAFGYRPLVWAAVKALAVGVIIGGMFAVKFWVKMHSLWDVGGGVLVVTAYICPIAFLLYFGLACAGARQVADVMTAYNITVTSPRRRRAEVDTVVHDRVSLRDCEAYIRKTFQVRDLTMQGNRLSAVIGRFIWWVRQHRLDVAIAPASSDERRVHLVVETPPFLRLYPDADLDGIAMLVYLVRWAQGHPLPVSPAKTNAWQTWRTIRASAAEYQSPQHEGSRPAEVPSAGGGPDGPLVGSSSAGRLGPNLGRRKRWLILCLVLVSFPLTRYLRDHTISHGQLLPWDPKLLPLIILDIGLLAAMVTLLLSGRERSGRVK